MDQVSKLQDTLASFFRRDQRSQLGREKEALSRDDLSDSRPASASAKSHGRRAGRQSSHNPMQPLDALDLELQSKHLSDRQAGTLSVGAQRSQPASSNPGLASKQPSAQPAPRKRDLKLFKLDPQHLQGDSALLGESLAVSQTILQPEELPSHPYNEALISPKRSGQERLHPKPAQDGLPHYMVPKNRFPPFNQKLQTHHLMSREEKARVKHRQLLLDHEKKVYQVSRMKPADKVQVASGHQFAIAHSRSKDEVRLIQEMLRDGALDLAYIDGCVLAYL